MRDQGHANPDSILWSDAAGRDMKRMIGEKLLRAAAKRFEVELSATLLELFAFAPEFGVKLTLLGADRPR